MRISDTEKAVKPSYLYNPDKDDRDLHRDHIDYDPLQRSSKWAPRPYSLSEIIYDYDSEDEGQRGYERDTQDRYHEIASYPLNQYREYLDDGGRRRYVHTDTGDEQFYSQWQPGLLLDDGKWSEDYNYIRPSQSSIRDEAYREWYETTHPRPYTLDGAIEYWSNRRRQLQRCQANHPLSYEAFLRANQPSEGHPADDTWSCTDYT